MKSKLTMIFLSLFVLVILLPGITKARSLFQKEKLVDPLLSSVDQSYAYPASQTDLPARTDAVTPVAPNTAEPSPTPFPPIEWGDPFACENKSICAQWLISEAGNHLCLTQWTAQGWKTEPLHSNPRTSSGKLKILGNGVASPNGQWAAFVSGGRDAGGPIFLVNLKTGEWINLIEKMNVANPDHPGLDEDAWWDVIGWFPESQRILVGPSDLGSVYLVELNTFQFQGIALKTGGTGGSSIVSLAPDGSGFVYVGDGAAVQDELYYYDLASNTTATVLKRPSEDVFIHYPRFSPDGESISFITQKGHPTSGVTYSIHLYSLESRTNRILIEGNLGLSIPTWSPDGKYLAFIKKEPDEPDLVIPGKAPDRTQGNLWIITREKQARQITFIHGSVLNPVWANDGKMIAFTTHNGEVGAVSIDTPGHIWRVDSGSTTVPLFTSVAFIPE